MDAHKLPGVHRYEVVKPHKLHSYHKRDLQAVHPDSIQYGLTVEGKSLVLNLEKNKNLIAKGYSETHYLPNGQEVTSTPQYEDHCYYHGYVQNVDDSSVSISTCDGVRGYFRVRTRRYLIEPLLSSDTDDHALYRYESLQEQPKTCGVTNTTWEDGNEPRVAKSSTDEEKKNFISSRKFVELYLVADNSEYKKQDGNIMKVKKRLFEIVNFINMVYKAINTHVALVGIEIWSDEDKIEVSSVSGTTLDRFISWRNSKLNRQKQHDNAQLLTNVDFDGSTVGLAFVGTLCGSHSGGINQDHSSNAIAVGATVAHEMGHNLGMSHDKSSCKCSSGSCIMQPSLSYNYPKEFSICSLQNFQNFIVTKMPQCMRNMPSAEDIVADPVCGNNFQEQGEECDCGTPEECKNPCCDAQTCKMKESAQCAQGECCENCKIMTVGAKCRNRKDECDLPEFCTGQSAQCPRDKFRVNGYPCQNGQGYCNNGKCPLLEDQCHDLYGSGAKVGENNCYQKNSHGKYYGYCKKISGTLVGCKQKDIKCGKLYCSGGNNFPSYGIKVYFDNCQSSFTRGAEEDSAMVKKGTKCGNGLVCRDGECLDLETVYKSTNCSSKCRGHAVCDHELQCQCEEGWLSPNCDEHEPLKTGEIIAIVIAVLVFILIISVIIFIVYQRIAKKKSYLHSQQPNRIAGLSNPAFSSKKQQKPAPTPIIFSSQFPLRPSAPPPPPPSQVSKPEVTIVIPPQVPSNKPVFPKPSGQYPMRTAPPVPASKPVYTTGDSYTTGVKKPPPPGKPVFPARPPQALKPNSRL
nr:PREDICTED: disintegrin and metalloproteinase domain-containing protein 28 [Latimeria chalumnae]|eukprot:XP_005991939.1 PREDICTED: disintegrin and metalloproteinase domain-containing protein 28 [Latimeria chalumnae]